MVAGLSPTESWRFDIQLPGIGLALLLMAVAGPFALMFGASGQVLLAAVTILTNGFVTLLITLILAVREPLLLYWYKPIKYNQAMAFEPRVLS